METRRFVFNPFQINCYVHYDENSKDCVLIDPAVYTEQEIFRLLEFIETNNLNVKYILNTHGHIDHILGNELLDNKFNVKIFLHQDDMFLLENMKEQGQMFGLNVGDIQSKDNYISGFQKFVVGNNDIKIIHTPGHSPGGVCFVDENSKTIFCGDLIFKQYVGRTDLPGSDYDKLMNSIKNVLFRLYDDDYILYPGHLGKTTIGEEKRNNPYII